MGTDVAVGSSVGTGREVGIPVVVDSGAFSEEHATPTESAIVRISSGRIFIVDIISPRVNAPIGV